jgi:hypothetical protein
MVRMILAVLLFSGAAHAEVMYRCVGKSGAVSYQDYPCAKGAKTTVAAEFTPEPVPAYRPPQHQQSQTVNRSSGSAGVLHNVKLQTDHCAQVKADRDAWEKSVGLRRTFDSLRRWQDRVNHACK